MYWGSCAHPNDGGENAQAHRPDGFPIRECRCVGVRSHSETLLSWGVLRSPQPTRSSDPSGNVSEIQARGSPESKPLTVFQNVTPILNPNSFVLFLGSSQEAPELPVSLFDFAMSQYR